MKNKLIEKRNEIKNKYGSYLATECFSKERILLGRINYILLYRYNFIK